MKSWPMPKNKKNVKSSSIKARKSLKKRAKKIEGIVTRSERQRNITVEIFRAEFPLITLRTVADSFSMALL